MENHHERKIIRTKCPALLLISLIYTLFSLKKSSIFLIFFFYSFRSSGPLDVPPVTGISYSQQCRNFGILTRNIKMLLNLKPLSVCATGYRPEFLSCYPFFVVVVVVLKRFFRGSEGNFVHNFQIVKK